MKQLRNFLNREGGWNIVGEATPNYINRETSVIKTDKNVNDESSPAVKMDWEEELQ